ncbi:hypothetical protein ACV4V9_29900 [Pseudomonas aeruginosa]
MRAQQRLSQAFQNCLDSLLDRSRAYTLAVRRIDSLVSAGLGQEAMVNAVRSEILMLQMQLAEIEEAFRQKGAEIAAQQLLVEHLPITIEPEDHDELG